MMNTTLKNSFKGCRVMLAATALLGTVASASLNAATIFACVGPNGGMRIIDPGKGETCRPPETSLSWNTTGPQGPQGIPGANGTNGVNGVSGYEIVRDSFDETSPGGNIGFGVGVSCPAGKKILSVGGDGNWIIGNSVVSFALVTNSVLQPALNPGEVDRGSVTVTKPSGDPFAAGERVAGFVQAVCAIAL